MSKKILVLLIIICSFLYIKVNALDIARTEIDSVNYSLEIGDTYKESIDAILSKNARKIALEDESDIPPLEYILLYEKQYPIYSNLKTEYEKEIKEENDRIIVSLEYEYSEEEFKNSTYLKNCFENSKVDETKEYIEYKLSGNFYCRHDKDYNIDIITDYEVISTNGNKSGNIYHWTIGDDKVDINIKIKRNNVEEAASNKEDNKKKSYWWIIAIVVGTLILLFLLRSGKGRKKKYF